MAGRVISHEVWTIKPKSASFLIVFFVIYVYFALPKVSSVVLLLSGQPFLIILGLYLIAQSLKDSPSEALEASAIHLA